MGETNFTLFRFILSFHNGSLLPRIQFKDSGTILVGLKVSQVHRKVNIITSSSLTFSLLIQPIQLSFVKAKPLL